MINSKNAGNSKKENSKNAILFVATKLYLFQNELYVDTNEKFK